MVRDYESQEQNPASHISYKDYKKMLKKNPKKQSITLFLGVFFVLLLVFLGMAKMMSPDVDITLGNDETHIVEENMPRGEIDDRLRDLQMEDEGRFGSEEMPVEDGDKVIIPKHEKAEDGENKLPEETLGQKAVKDVVGVETVSHPKPQAPEPAINHQYAVVPSAPAPVQQAAAPSITARVIVGNYPTIEQADVAKGILQDAGLGVVPFVRKMGEGYTLQVASYSSKEKAMSVAESLLNQNFPAKVVVEYK